MGQAYLGAIGRTRTATVHVSDARGALVAVLVYTGVDAAASPALAEQLRGDALNVVQLDGRALRLAVPVVYHDPAAGLLVLVLGDAHRHRELDERIRVLEQLRDDTADVPAYAKDFAVVFGAAGLRAYLDERARRRDTLTELAAARVELARRTGPLGYDTDRFEAAAAEVGIDLPRGFGRGFVGDGDGDPEIEVQREIEADDPADAPLDDDVRFDERSFDGEPAFADPFPDSFEDSIDGEVPFDENSFDEELSLDESVDDSSDDVGGPDRDAAPGAGGSNGAAPGGNGLGRGATEDDDGAGLDGAGLDGAGLDDAGLDVDSAVDADAELEAALEAETGVDSPDPLGEPELSADTAPSAVAEAADAAGLDPLTTELAELPLADEPGDGTAAAGGAAIGPREPGWYADDAGVQLVIAAGGALAAALAGPLDLRLVLHRAPTAPVIALVIGSPAVLHQPAPDQLAIATLDIAGEPDRGVLRALGRSFALVVTLVGDGRALRRCRLTAPLAENVGYLVQAADEHLHDVTARGALDHQAARALVLGAGFDLLGIGHPERGELRADRLAHITTAQQLRRALAIARRFSQPALEDYLVCTRGFPLSRWHQLRRKTVAHAVAWGVWMGPELAQIAVSEGFARSRRDLVVRLDRGFEKLRHDARAFDIDAEATADNAAAIAAQARALGIELRRAEPNGAGAIGSDAAPVAAGSIEPAASPDATPLPAAILPMSTDELLAALDDNAPGRGGRARRLAAALALCDHGDPRVARPVIAAALHMSRGEAVQVLARAVKLGAAAHPALIGGLASSKAYLRHGCALALALARSDDATQAVIGLLLSEPTELWHEIARAIGEIGTPALVWLVRDVGSCGPAAEERIVRAMAHVGAAGGEPALTAMAAAESIVSPIATKALELLAALGRDPAAGSPVDPDLSVNHAFSRQFFEALERRTAGESSAELVVRDAPAAAES